MITTRGWGAGGLVTVGFGIPSQPEHIVILSARVDSDSSVVATAQRLRYLLAQASVDTSTTILGVWIVKPVGIDVAAESGVTAAAQILVWIAPAVVGSGETETEPKAIFGARPYVIGVGNVTVETELAPYDRTHAVPYAAHLVVPEAEALAAILQEITSPSLLAGEMQPTAAVQYTAPPPVTVPGTTITVCRPQASASSPLPALISSPQTGTSIVVVPDMVAAIQATDPQTAPSISGSVLLPITEPTVVIVAEVDRPEAQAADTMRPVVKPGHK